jgi:Poly(ADP-ribose) polymerase and DNA-Ligase Zn-finger region
MDDNLARHCYFLLLARRSCGFLILSCQGHYVVNLQSMMWHLVSSFRQPKCYSGNALSIPSRGRTRLTHKIPPVFSFFLSSLICHLISVKYAKTGRATCKNPKCQEKIDKDSIRITHETEGGEYNFCKHYHVTCFKVPRKLISEGVTVEDFVDEYLVDTSDQGDILTDPEKRAAIKSKGVVKKKNPDGTFDDGPSLMERLKEAAKGWTPPEPTSDGDDDKDSKPPAAKKVKTDDGKPPSSAGGPTKDAEADFQDMLGLYHKYSKMKVAELKDFLRWNKQIMKGGKEFVTFKVLDGELHGRLGLCPLCQGDLKFEEGDFDTVHCSGRYDEDWGRRIFCKYTVGRLDPKCTRLTPWHTEKPSEEEMEEMTKAKEEARDEGEGGDYVDQPTAVELLKAAEGLEIDLETDAGKKAAAAKYAELVEDKLDLPEGRNIKMEVGKLIMAQTEKSPKEIMQAIITKFGIKEAKDAKSAKKEEAAESACANPKNAKLILAFRECSKYYFDGTFRRSVQSTNTRRRFVFCACFLCLCIVCTTST